MDVLSFFTVLILYIWVVMPVTDGDPVWNVTFILLALTVVGVSVWRRHAQPRSLGLRVDNFLPSLGIYMAVALVYASVVLVWHMELLGQRPFRWPGPSRMAGAVFWAFLQQFCLLAFLLTRIREMVGRELLAVFAAAGLFAFFHLPNPFLTLYTLGGGLIVAALYLRWPNVLAAAIAHATASYMVGKLLPKFVTGSMKVGPAYWGLG